MRFAAVITETRPIDFKRIVDKHIPYLPECDLVVFSYDNKVNVDCINHRLERNVTTLVDYNYLMTSQWFWDRLKDYEKVLIFQNDSEILKYGIDEFFEWDYVGAPWSFQHQGGNGGLSLRDVKAMKEVLKEPYSPVYGYEDVYFSNQMFHRGMNIAPREVCEKFSCETIFKLGTLGYHAIDNYLSIEQCHLIRNQYKKN